ncbi:hypothetical protein BC939DRAFT_319085 [Gamsiella multidivaricata]|uniref:uncharacterized protein n=1 Tax=Gamsiella multidivaricata TaxID=101098 RepID=UPI00221FE2E3|nr:uncharacterized protein BC939DRAFT_319085 [Gamsiella multidivaricata]KAI7817621.1 hypothetical protein BC939DRAFT_319085 [Gamsiella multidivaricata]
MVAIPSTSHPSDGSPPDPSSQDAPHQRQQGPFHRRPRFLRSITSPIPALREAFSFDSDSSTSSSSVGTIKDHHHHPSFMASIAESATTIGPPDTSQEQTLQALTRPRVHPVQQDRQPNGDGQQRSHSTPSVPPPYMAQTSASSSSKPSSSQQQPRSSITESLKEHRWSKGLKFNWMPGFGSSGRKSPGLERCSQSSSSISSSFISAE